MVSHLANDKWHGWNGLIIDFFYVIYHAVKRFTCVFVSKTNFITIYTSVFKDWFHKAFAKGVVSNVFCPMEANPFDRGNL